jgi:hypothetical protein
LARIDGEEALDLLKLDGRVFGSHNLADPRRALARLEARNAAVLHGERRRKGAAKRRRHCARDADFGAPEP